MSAKYPRSNNHHLFVSLVLSSKMVFDENQTSSAQPAKDNHYTAGVLEVLLTFYFPFSIQNMKKVFEGF